MKRVTGVFLAALTILLSFSNQSLALPATASVIEKCRALLTNPLNTPDAKDLLLAATKAMYGSKKLPPKIIILSSEFGEGHNSASASIAKTILTHTPDANVVIKRVEDLRPEWFNKLQLKSFWFMIKKMPWLFDWAFKTEMDGGRKANHPLDRRLHVDPSSLENYLKAEMPDGVIVAHQLTADILAGLRKDGKLREIPIAYNHTDFFVGFFPNTSSYLDYTWLPHERLARVWEDSGVPSDKIRITGMAVDNQAFSPAKKTESDLFLEAQGLSPNISTITLASGGEGIGNYPEIVKQIANVYSAKSPKEPLQIIAVCGRNISHLEALEQMRPELLARDIILRPLPFIKRTELFQYIRASRVYITKSGGLSPPEAFAISSKNDLGVVLMDVYGGHERENARFFESLGVAEINRDPKEIGNQVYRLLNTPLARQVQKAEHIDFHSARNEAPVVEFVDHVKALKDQKTATSPLKQY